MPRPLSDSTTPSWRSSALWTAMLGALFFFVYGGTNWITSLRSDVGSMYFEWERMIPFVPALIIPYMSIDLFFAASPFLCTSRSELHTLAKRSVFAILLSALCFLLFPLRFAFERPQVIGLLGRIFDLLATFDRPYNLVPSLHISLLAIIWVVYRARTRGALRAALDGWFILIAISTLLTYQHHVLDVVSGTAVATVAFHLFPEPAPETSRAGRLIIHPDGQEFSEPRRRSLAVGTRYALLAMAFFLGAVAAWPWSVVLLWPATTFAMMATAYFGAGEIVFRKSNGRVPKRVWLIFAPYLWGAHLSFLYCRRGCPAYTEVVPGILIGRKLSETESEGLILLGVRAVLDLTAEYSESKAFRRLAYHNVQVLDLTAPTLDQLAEAVAFVHEHRSEGTVYIHCALGYSRSACVAAAYLLAERLAKSLPEATWLIRQVRPQIVIHDDLMAVLDAFHSRIRLENGPAPLTWTWELSRSSTSLPEMILIGGRGDDNNA